MMVRAMTLALSTSDAEYDISFQLELDGNPNATAEVRKISHVKICEYNGMKKLGGWLEETLGCECVRDHHCCNTAAAIRIEVAKKKVNGIEDSDFEPEWEGGPLPPCGVKVADIMSMDKQNNKIKMRRADGSPMNDDLGDLDFSINLNAPAKEEEKRDESGFQTQTGWVPLGSTAEEETKSKSSPNKFFEFP